MSAESLVTRAADGEKVATGWGELNWKITDQSMSGTEMTFGTCFIQAGKRNALHSHPNCEEILYVVSGECEHRIDEETVLLKAGDAIRIPRNVRHWAKALGSEPLFALIVFSSGQRQAISHEGDAIG
jgi:quercetin dioxygenase-like cupin family protein